ncbi:MAG: hypothetical protein OXD01_02270 [Gammaproteobacteria bacterium]|nr:hypothetical protein [Gammaproteobacteria bacterium]
MPWIGDIVSPMFIRSTKIETAAIDCSRRLSHRLVTNWRDGNKVRQKTLLNLGVYFNIDKAVWPELGQRVEALTSCQQSLVELALPPTVEA